jgi:hypothetical protein
LGLCALFAAVATLLFAWPNCAAAQTIDALNYSLDVKPQSLKIDTTRGPKTYKQTFTFTVINTSKTSFAGLAPSCQLFDIEVFREDSSGDELVWKWSKTQNFCDKMTPVTIAPGVRWQRLAIWEFAGPSLKGGQYKAVATFIPSHGKVAVEYKIESFVVTTE